MFVRLALVLILGVISHVAFAQGTGLDFDDADYQSIPSSSYDGSKGSQIALDTTLKVDLKPYCPEVIHQGDMQSCVGWSCGYEAMTIANAIKHDWKGETEKITQNAFSAMFIFNQITRDNCGGSRLADAMVLLFEKGNLFSSEFDSDIDNCARFPRDADLTKAAENRILDYTALFASNASERVKIDQIKLALIEKHPVIVGMELRKNFQLLTRGTKYWWPDAGNTDLFGGHAMVVVGFDEGKQAFELMNTWGKTWGNNGYIWIKYDDFAKFCRYAVDFVFEPGEMATRNVLYGDLELKKPSGMIDDEVILADLQVELEAGVYTQTLAFGEKPGLFQLIANKFATNSYLYVIGEAKNGKPELHWPKDSRIDKNANDQSKSACLRSGNWSVPLPEKYKAFQIEDERDERLYIVISKRPLTNSLSNSFWYCRKYKKDFGTALEKYEGKALIPSEDITLAEDAISFHADSRSGDIVVIELVTTGIKE
jgi:hypothetical protein